MQNGNGNANSKDADSLKQNLVRATLARQTLELEKKELLVRIDELESAMNKNKSSSGSNPANKLQLEEFIKKQSDVSCNGVSLSALYANFCIDQCHFSRWTRTSFARCTTRS